jgi:hypothetical protein
MTQIEHLQCEIEEYRIEIENHKKGIRSLIGLIDKLERKIVELKRKETLEKYKPHLEGCVDKYIDSLHIDEPNSNKRIVTTGVCHKDFELIIQYYMSLKEQGYLIYVYKIGEPTPTDDSYWISHILIKEDK